MFSPTTWTNLEKNLNLQTIQMGPLNRMQNKISTQYMQDVGPCT